MKGISTILATILIVIIVVALVSLTYTFAIGLFGTAASSAERGVSATTIRMDKAVSIVGDPSCTKPGDTYTIVFTIRHLGSTYNITSTDVSAIFGGGGGNLAGLTQQLAPGSTVRLTWTNNTAVDYKTTGTTFTVSAPAADASKTITC